MFDATQGFSDPPSHPNPPLVSPLPVQSGSRPFFNPRSTGIPPRSPRPSRTRDAPGISRASESPPKKLLGQRLGGGPLDPPPAAPAAMRVVPEWFSHSTPQRPAPVPSSPTFSIRRRLGTGRSPAHTERIPSVVRDFSNVAPTRPKAMWKKSLSHATNLRGGRHRRTKNRSHLVEGLANDHHRRDQAPNKVSRHVQQYLRFPPADEGAVASTSSPLPSSRLNVASRLTERRLPTLQSTAYEANPEVVQVEPNLPDQLVNQNFTNAAVSLVEMWMVIQILGNIVTLAPGLDEVCMSIALAMWALTRRQLRNGLIKMLSRSVEG